jgi:hypothetical protein
MAILPSETANRVERSRLAFKKYDGLFSTIKLLIKYGTILGCVRYVYLAIAVLAGKATFADVGVKVLGNISISHGVCYALASGGILYGLGERQMRRRNIKRIGSLKNKYEEMLDLHRSSSGLTETGTTRPGDDL